jgi:metal-responsive CopG/Arc/MetJ family transcriptional regulator
MKKEYDFSKDKRGAIEKPSPGKTRITIRLDNEVIEWFRSQVEAKGGGNYQTMINEALREYIKNPAKTIQDTVRNTMEEYFHRHHRTVDAARLDLEEGAKKT